MQISSSYALPSMYSQDQSIQNQQPKEIQSKDVSIEEKQQVQNQETVIELGLPRQTYGLSVIEKMSDDEYQAFLRATAEMSESEKILAAQSLYRLNDLKNQANYNPYRSAQNDRDFQKIFHNAYQSILQTKNV